MNVFVKILLATFGTLVVVRLIIISHRIQGYGNTIVSHHPGACRHIKGIETKGSEDMTLLPSGQIIISSGLVGFSGVVDHAHHGALYLIDTIKDMENAVRLNIEGVSEDEHFSPHGIHHWVHKNGSVSVFVAVHQPERVLRFLFDGQKTLTLTKVYKSKQHFRNLNGVFVTSENSFYVTNIMKADFGDKLGMTLEFVLNLPRGNVVYVNGDTCEIALDGLHAANGLTGNDKYLYVAVLNNIHLYRISSDKSLKLYKAIPIVIGSVDNLKLDGDGGLWAGCQPILQSILDHLEDPNKTCHSQVLRIRDPEDAAVMESVFLDDGNFLSGSTVALYVKGKMIVGTVQHKAAVCDVHYLINS